MIHLITMFKYVDGTYRPSSRFTCGVWVGFGTNYDATGERVSCQRCRKSRAWENIIERNKAAIK